MIKDHEYLSLKASYCLDIAKKLGATDSSVFVGNSISITDQPIHLSDGEHHLNKRFLNTSI